MYVANKAPEIFRENLSIFNLKPQNPASQACLNAGRKLKECLVLSGVSVLDAQAAREACETTQWRSNCTGQWRRFFVQRIYIEQTNQKLYNQEQIDNYMQKKTHQKHASTTA